MAVLIGRLFHQRYTLRGVWYDAWPTTAVTDPHEPIADELVRLLGNLRPAEVRTLVEITVSTDPSCP